MRNFRNYDVWKMSHKLALKIYSETKSFPKEEIYGIISQLRRAAYSVPTNISEGAGRSTDAQFANFIDIALGSANEVEYLLLLSKDLEFLEKQTYLTLDKEVNLVKRSLYRLHQKLKQ